MSTKTSAVELAASVIQPEMPLVIIKFAAYSSQFNIEQRTGLKDCINHFFTEFQTDGVVNLMVFAVVPCYRSDVSSTRKSGFHRYRILPNHRTNNFAP